MPPAHKTIVVRPESHDDIREEAKRLLRRAKAMGVYPTPVDAIVNAASVEEIQDFEQARRSFLGRASDALKAVFESALGKLRGFADLRNQRTYVTPDPSIVRSNWVRLHEVGHQVLPWQGNRIAYQDDDTSLSADCEELFDTEANAFAAEVLFQAERFAPLARSPGSSFESIFSLADQFGASRHATARRLAEEARDAALLVTYYPSRYTVLADGERELRLGRGHAASERFLRKYEDLLLPKALATDHPWAGARRSALVHAGTMTLECADGTKASFRWEAWWNQYRVLVLLWKPAPFTVLRGR